MNFAYEGPATTTDISILDKLTSIQRGTLGADIETNSIEDDTPIGISFAINPREAFYFPFSSPMMPWDKLKNPDIKLVIHNGHFDLGVLNKYFKITPPNVVDSIIAVQTLGIPPPETALNRLAWDMFQVRMTTIEDLLGPRGKNQKKMNSLAEDVIAKKCTADSRLCLRVWQRVEPDIPMRAFELDMRVLPALMKMEQRGMRVDLAKLDFHIQRITHEFEKMLYLGRTMGFNLRSSDQVGKILESLGYTVKWDKKTGKAHLDKDVLKRDFPLEPIAHFVLKARNLSSLLADLIAIRDTHLVGDHIYGRIHQNVTATGRLSTSRPNRQNFTPDIRDIFIPEDGEEFEAWDFSQIEMRDLAYLSQDPTMMAVFDSGGDIHDQTSIFIHGDVLPAHRRVIKNCNFSMVYGGDWYTLHNRYQVPVDVAKALIAKYFSIYPRVKDYLYSVREQAHVKGYTETILGRRRTHYAINNGIKWMMEKAERELLNHVFQGSAGEHLKEMHARFEDEPQVNTVHDETIFSITPKHVFDYSMLDGIADFRTPIAIKRGMNWKDMVEVKKYG